MEFDRTFKVTFFEGSHGITLPIVHGEIFFYYTFLVAAFLIVAAVYVINDHKFGYALKAIKGSRRFCRTGRDQHTQIQSARLCAQFIDDRYTRGINASWLTYISPTDVFSVIHTIQMIIMALLEALGPSSGRSWVPVLLSITNEVIGAKLLYTYLLMLGIIIICHHIPSKRYSWFDFS